MVGAPPPPGPLAGRLREILAREGPLRFDRFLEAALYDPAGGYYRRPRDPFGRRGDFYTAPHTTPVFGACVARRLESLWAEAGRPRDWQYVELGSGDGRLAADLLRSLSTPLPIEGAWLVERSESRRDEGLRTVRAASPVPVRAAAELAALEPFAGVVVANELLDALPVRRFRKAEAGWEELYVTIRDGAFVESPGTVDPLPRGFGLPEPAVVGATYEFAPESDALLRALADRLTDGAVLLLDFGRPTEAWTRSPSAGTLTAIRAHTVVPDPLQAPGECDLSSFVDRDALRAGAARAGFRELACRSQREALFAWGLPELAEGWIGAAPDPTERVRRGLALKSLTLGFESFFALELEVPRGR